MIRVDQTIFAGDPKLGNCVAACVATLLDLPLERVPHFIGFGVAYGDSTDVHDVSSGAHWWAMLTGFMAGHGLWPVQLESVTHGEVDEVLFVAGPSPRGVTHQVLYRNGRLWHDPHPSREGVLDVIEVLAWRPLPAVGFDHAPTQEVDDADPS